MRRCPKRDSGHARPASGPLPPVPRILERLPPAAEAWQSRARMSRSQRGTEALMSRGAGGAGSIGIPASPSRYASFPCITPLHHSPLEGESARRGRKPEV
ncbi:MAG: hypothetical protein OXU61_00930, partial [Gammaproteobacteria bacterium]|nr:hypothetical protein [Gammaproteobacteria bacterium]